MPTTDSSSQVTTCNLAPRAVSRRASRARGGRRLPAACCTPAGRRARGSSCDPPRVDGSRVGACAIARSWAVESPSARRARGRDGTSPLSGRSGRRAERLRREIGVRLVDLRRTQLECAPQSAKPLRQLCDESAQVTSCNLALCSDPSRVARHNRPGFTRVLQPPLLLPTHGVTCRRREHLNVLGRAWITACSTKCGRRSRRVRR